MTRKSTPELSSLAGVALQDADASVREKSLAASVLSQAGIGEAKAVNAAALDVVFKQRSALEAEATRAEQIADRHEQECTSWRAIAEGIHAKIADLDLAAEELGGEPSVIAAADKDRREGKVLS